MLQVPGEKFTISTLHCTAPETDKKVCLLPLENTTPFQKTAPHNSCTEREAPLSAPCIIFTTSTSQAPANHYCIVLYRSRASCPVLILKKISNSLLKKKSNQRLAGTGGELTWNVPYNTMEMQLPV